jgi:hypothetical protein
VPWFSTRPKVVGCSIGISPGDVPVKILPTTSATRRDVALRLLP